MKNVLISLAIAGSACAHSTAAPNLATPRTVMIVAPGNQHAIGMAPGVSLQLSAVAEDARGDTLRSVVVSWMSTQPSVVSVDSTGLIVAGSTGTAFVHATVVGTHPALSDSLTVFVMNVT